MANSSARRFSLRLRRCDGRKGSGFDDKGVDWDLETMSVWRKRPRRCDAGAIFDSEDVFARCFDFDWDQQMARDSFRKFVCRAAGGSKGDMGTADADEIAQIKAALMNNQ